MIITVVLMLILSGVAIRYVVNEGWFDKTSEVIVKNQRESMLEVVEAAEAYLENEHLDEYDYEPDIVSLVNKIKETSDMGNRNYEITVDETNQIATIVHNKTGVVIDIVIQQGEVIVSDTVLGDVGNTSKPIVTYFLSPEKGTDENGNVTIKLLAIEETNGIAKIKLPDNTVRTYNNDKEVEVEYVVNTDGMYKFIVEGGNGRVTTQYVKVNISFDASGIRFAVDERNLTKDDVEVQIFYDKFPKVGNTTLKNEDRWQYSIGEDNWQIATTEKMVLDLETNAIVYARYFDGINEHQKTNVLINNIDKIGPEPFNLNYSVTTNSITVSGSTIDLGTEGVLNEYIGIRGYQFRLLDEDGDVVTNWTKEQTGTSYTFNNLKHSTLYKVSMRAVDMAGNRTEAINKNQEVLVGIVPDSEAKIGVQYSPSTVTNGDVDVTFTNNSENNNLILKYQLDNTDGEWIEYTEPVKVRINRLVHARLFDNIGQYENTATANIFNIDKALPMEFEFITDIEGNSISVIGETQDTGSIGTDEEYIGIQGYKFKLEDKDGNVVVDWTSIQPIGSYIFTDLRMNREYIVSMKAVDLAGNERDAMNNGTSVELLLPDSSLATNLRITRIPDGITNGNIKVKIENLTGIDDLTVKYQIDGTEDGNWTPYTEEIAMNSNGTVYARLFDTEGEYNNTGECIVDNIDKVAPNDFGFTVTATSIRIKITGSTTDIGSEGTNLDYIGIQGYQYKLTYKDGTVVSDWTDIKEGGVYSFVGLTKLTDYKVSMRAVDLAGNTTDSSENGKDISTTDIADSALDGNITFGYSPSGATNGNVDVTISNTSGDNDLILKYQVGGTDDDKWEPYTSAIPMTTNGDIYARLFDEGGNYKNTATGTVNNIDREAPLPFEFAVSVTGDSITIKAETTDIGSEGTDEQYIGAYMYTYKLFDSNGTQVMSSGTSSKSITKTGLTEGATYYVSVIARDRANNETPASNNNYEVTLPVFPDCYVALYTDGTLAFSNNEEAFDQSLLSKSYGNIKNKIYTGNYERLEDGTYGYNYQAWYSERANITAVEFLNEIRHVSTASWFNGCSGLTNMDFTNLNMSDVKNMSMMFKGCSGLTELDLSDFVTDNVEDMSGMFMGCSGIEEFDLSDFVTTNVEDMSLMFQGCSGLTSLNLTMLETGNVTDMSSMFYECKNLETVDFTGWDTSKVTSMSGLFRDANKIAEIPTEIFENAVELKSISSAFMRTKITTIPEDFLQNCTKLENLSWTFWGGYYTEIPENLFKGLYNIKYLDNTFNSADITTIPENLLKDCINVECVSEMFRSCSDLVGPIPAKLFTTCTKLKEADGIFMSCSNLEGSIPEDLFKYNTEVEDFSYVFNYCPKLTGSIPENLFKYNTKVKYFGGLFNGCKGLTGSIPENLFVNCPEVLSFGEGRSRNIFGVFSGCTGLTGTIPADLFKYNTKVKDFSGLFSGCIGLVGSIPENLFDSSKSTAKEFEFTFIGCTGLTGEIPANLFDGYTAITNVGRLFMNCTGLTGGIPKELLSDATNLTDIGGLYAGCTGLTGSIPANLFEENLNIQIITYSSQYSNVPVGLFEGCTGLTGSIPANLFENNTEITNFTQVFDGCTGLTGDAPEYWNRENVTLKEYCFRNCTNLTNYDAIPAEWK